MIAYLRIVLALVIAASCLRVICTNPHFNEGHGATIRSAFMLRPRHGPTYFSGLVIPKEKK
ncbi:hypothetical protein MJ571_11230 [Klebsiella pneumoniae]|nr:hypothetical protein MJ571_11230 [Klebsiella pneumoniae]